MARSLLVPPIIGICGYPTHGKSTAQRFLSLLGVEARDDAELLRRRACKRFNLTWEQVTTQAGKQEIVHAYGQEMTVRQALGDFGQEFENAFGPNYWVEIAVEQLKFDRVKHPVSFGSLRRSQPSVVKANNGFVLAIMDPRKDMRNLHHFDEYDFDDIDCMVFNDSSLLDLGTRVLIAVSEYLTITPEQAAAAMAAFEKEIS